jgi:hypothetical protein
VTATTIKVPRELRDRINHDAGQRGLTAAALLAELLDDYERGRRLMAFGRAFAAGRDAEYQADTDLWDNTSADGDPDV